MSPLLFILVLLGYGRCQLFLAPSADDGSSEIVKTFIKSLFRALGTPDVMDLVNLFSSDFFFQGCYGIYNRQMTVDLIEAIPVGTHLETQLYSSQFIDENRDIHFRVKAEGFIQPASDVEFFLFLRNGKYVLIGGRIPNCTQSNFYGSLRQLRHRESRGIATVEEMAKMYFDGLTKAINAHDASSISMYFSNAIQFHGCKGIYTKDYIVDLLLRLPRADTSLYNQFTAEFNENKAIVVKSTHATFLLKNDEMIGGKIIRCD